MKLTRKMSPVLFGLVVIIIVGSMIGTAFTVLVSQNPGSSTANVNANNVSVTKSDAAIAGLGNWAQDYPYLDDAVTPVVGSTYDLNITAYSSASLANVKLVFKISNADGAIDSSNILVKEYHDNVSTGHWTPLNFESYGDYMLASFYVDASLGTDISVTPGWNAVYSFMVEFLKLGTYTFEWYATSVSSAQAA